MKMIFVLLMILLLSSCAANQAKDKLRIGAILPLTGGTAAVGDFNVKGITIAQELQESQGNPMEIIFEDDGCDPKKTVTAYRKLVDVDHVDVILGPVCSGSALAAAPLSTQDKIIILSPGATSPQFTSAGDYAFRVSYNDKNQAKFMADHLASKYDRIAILYSQSQQAVVDIKKAFVSEFKNNITAIESFTDQDADVKDQLLKIKGTDPQALLILVFPANYPTVTKQISESKIGLPLYAVHTFETPVSLTLGKDAEKYTYSIQSYSHTTDAAKSFIDSFQKKYSQEPGVFSAWAYDAAMLIGESQKHCTDAECVKNFLYSTKEFQGASGEKTFDENGDIMDAYYTLKIVRDGKFVPLVG